MESEPFFLRSASGLVRTAGPWDIFAFNFGLISVGIALTLIHSEVPSNYANASLPLAETLAAVLMACIALAFWAWTVTIPRSGGLYAFVSRGLSPLAGFTFSFVDSLTWLFYNAIAASYITTIGLAPGLFTYGYLSGHSEYMRFAIILCQPLYQFAVGAIVILLATVLIIVGMRAFFRVQALAVTIAIIGTIITAVTLANAAPDGVQHVFVKAFAPYAPPLGEALSRHNALTPVSWQGSAFALVWPLLSFVGSIFSVNIGGEVRQARRSQAVGMFGSIAVALGLLVLLSTLGDRAFGFDFQTALVKFQATTPNPSLPLPPYFSLLAALAAQQPWTAAAICIGFLAWAFLWIPATLVYSARAALAWAFDRVAPAWFGYVHPRFHTPANALIAAAVLNVVFLALYLFTAFFNTLVPVLAAMIAWIPTMLAAIIFPYWRRNLYERTPLATQKVLGLPFLTFAGLIGLVATSLIVWMLWNDPIAAGHDPATLGVIGAMFASGAVWYLVAKLVRGRQGLPIDRAYKEIPIE